MLARRDVVGSREVVRQLVRRGRAARHRARIDQLAVGQQLEGEHVDLLLRLLAFADHVAEVVVRERRLDAVRRVVRERQRDRAGRRDRAVVREARALLRELVDQFRRDFGDALHVAAVARVQDAARELVADLAPSRTISGRLRSISAVTSNSSLHDRRRALLSASSRPASQPAIASLARDALGEADRLRASRTSCPAS